VAGPARPVVLCVGSLEPRKNQLAVLYAAERLWRENLEFEVRLIGGGGWQQDVLHQLDRLQSRGRPVKLRLKIDDDELAAEYRVARFIVQPSLHEGFGLPLAESLSFGTPIITSNFGSTAEIAAAGGALLVDPHDDETLVIAMRTLLSDDARLQKLKDEIAARPARTWNQYAAELWTALVQPELESLGRQL
jgi:glycosyltransferase involved in cell wall biosynthesis